MLRMPLWLHLTRKEFESMRERLPGEGALLLFYSNNKSEMMVEVHVDLDDSFDAHRASLPLGGGLSVRFPGGCPTSASLRVPPELVPNPGADLKPISDTAQEAAAAALLRAVEAPATAAPLAQAQGFEDAFQNLPCSRRKK